MKDTLIELDRVDLQLLHELQIHGRTPIAELARRVNLSPTPCTERLKRLERDGFIRNYSANIDPSLVGFPVLAFVEVSLDRTTPELFERFKGLVLKLDQVLECHMVAGQFDYLLKIRAQSLNAFRQFLGQELTAVPGIQHTHTYLALEELKSTSALPLKTGLRTRKKVRVRAR